MTLSSATSPGSNTVNALLVDKKGGLWVGTTDGLDYLDPQTKLFTHYQNDPKNPASLSDNHVLVLYQDRYDVIWAGTEEGGLNRYNPANNSFNRYQPRADNPYTLSGSLVNAIYEDQGGHLWVGGRNGLNQYNRGDEYFTRYQHDPNNPYSLSNDFVLSIYTDRSGVLWIGTSGGGLSKYVQNNERFTLYQNRPGVRNSLSNNVVYALYEDRKSALWVGTRDGGLNRMDPEAGTFYAYKNNPLDPASLSNNEVRSIFEDRLDRLWVGTYGGGLNYLDRERGRFTRYIHDPNNSNSLSDNRIIAIYEDRRGDLWIGTREGGLDKMNPETGRFTHFQNDPNDPTSLSGNYVRTITEDHLGNLWVGTYTGISMMDPTTGQFQRFTADPSNPNSLSNNRVMSILETSDGTIWIGTLLGGLNRYDPATQTFRHYTQKQGLPSDAIYGILADRNGSLWLSTNRGLSRFNLQNETFRNYDRWDGLQGFEFNPGAYFENSRGRMYFGGIQGFNAFDPSHVQENPLAPQVVITSFNKFNQPEEIDLTEGQTITLPYTDDFISFEFAALDYAAPEKNQYAYKLEGFDKEWIKAGTRRYASYTNLRGGTYTFRVIGSNQDGVWNQEGASVKIIVIPPIWERWWFIGVLALALVTTAAGGYRLRIMSIQAQNRQLEEQVRERTHEIERGRQVAEGLGEILTILNSNRSLQESLDAIIAQVIRLMNAQGVFLFRCGEEGCPEIIASNLPEGQQLVTLPNWLVRPLLEGRKLNYPDVPGYLKAHGQQQINPFEAYNALLAVPLLVSDKIDGGLGLLSQENRIFSQEDVNMAASFADHAAMAIANALLRSQAEEIAVSAERSRLARDLHDAVTQTLFATSLIAEVLPRLWERNPEAGKQKITEIRELTRGALAEMRTLLMELRPNALMDVPLPDLLQQLSEAFTGRARVPVTLDVNLNPELPSNVKIGYYRIVQEALNNIQKHSRATQVEIQLYETDEQVVLCVQDNGIGFEKRQNLADHFGLRIMEERAQSIGAQFMLDSQVGIGTRIIVTWEKLSPV